MSESRHHHIERHHHDEHHSLSTHLHQAHTEHLHKDAVPAAPKHDRSKIQNKDQPQTGQTQAPEGAVGKAGMSASVEGSSGLANGNGEVAVLPRLDITENVRKHMAIFDPDGDGKITKQELARAASKSGSDKETTTAIVALTRNYEAMAAVKTDNILPYVFPLAGLVIDTTEPLTMRDLNKFSEISREPQGNKLVLAINEQVDAVSIEQSRNKDLFAERGKITPDAVRQGGVGDCSLIAALVGLSTTKSGREEIRNMIKPEGDGYHVTFPDGQHVHIATPTDAELNLYAGNTGKGIWPAVLEKAYATILAGKKGDVLAPQQAADKCEQFDPLGTLTKGHERVAVDPSKKTNDELHELLTRPDSNKMVMTAGSGPNPDAMRSNNVPCLAYPADARGEIVSGSTPINIAGFHVYCVDHYDSHSRTVYLRNPHQGSQLLRLPLNTFRQAFCGLNVIDKKMAQSK